MPRAVVRATRERQLLDEWSLVLTAAGIEHETGAVDGNYTVAVEHAAAARAVAALGGYDAERRRRSRRRWMDAEGSTNVAWLVPAAILLGYMWTGPVERGTLPFERGAAIAGQIRAGELWRIATALTLHADALHAASNAASSLVFLIPLCRILGGGTTLALSLYAGILATWINAFVRGPGYAGIGASTAVFAAVGLLAGLRVGGDAPRPLWRRLGPFGAALGILAMLGASPQTDVGAHLLGLATGTVSGAAFAASRSAAPSPAIDLALGASAVAVVVAAWLAALTSA
jgi:rhomboid protease GluP